MNRLFFILLTAAIVVAGYAMYINNDLGLMQVSFAEYHFEANLLEVGAVALGMLVAVLLLAHTIRLLKMASGLFGEKRSERLIEKAHHSLEQGLIELLEGRFRKSEKILLQKVEHNENALLAYLAAARAAQYQGAHERRDDYIRRAHQSAPDADIAIGLAHAELQMDHNQFLEALATLNHLNILSPQHPYVLKLLAETHHKLADWENLRELLPEAKKADVISDKKLRSMEIDTWCGLMGDRGLTEDIDLLTQLWDVMPRNMKTIPEVVERYAAELIKLHAAGEAEQVLRDFLNDNWVESSVILYSQLDVMASEEQISTMEGWLQDHRHDAHLLYALGKMCMSKNLWGPARNYLEASLAAKPMPAAYLKLAQLLEDHLEDSYKAQDYYRQGLHMLSGDYGEEALANAETDFKRAIVVPELRVI